MPGVVPAAVLFGTVMDYACILWEETCDGRGNCLYFDNFYMAMYMLALIFSIKFISALFTFFAWKFYKSNETLKSSDNVANVTMDICNENNSAQQIDFTAC